jgi:putative ABC transport system permease protein
MLELKNLSKNYYVGSQVIPALKNINLKFRRNEFVSILGPSGCGKTTMLNIIGGLDRYTSGDLLIDNKSTSEFTGNNWDAYRNSTIGFVFQNYNLISHLTVLDNVEMALSLSGVSAKERKERATKVLTDVGLADQLIKKPNQLSGGQMQRVAIARALVNDPKILLADEPTGALDTKTSHQIMKLIQEISKTRLVIMVTHNSKIAYEFSDRIINLLDGETLDDSNPVTEEGVSPSESLINKKTSMSYKQAIKTSFKNLITKKGRTFITAIAGSIGIIGIALVLAISTGMNDYVGEIQGDTLAGFPITISSVVATDSFGPPAGTPGGAVISEEDSTEFPDGDVVYPYDRSASTISHTNILDDEFITYLNNIDSSFVNSISYTSAVALQIVTESETGTYDLVAIDSGDFSFFGGSNVFNEIPDSQEFVESQYDLLSGIYPTSYNELVLVVDSENKVDVDILEALGYNIDDEYTFADFVGKEFKVIPNDVYYTQLGEIYLPSNDYETMYNDADAITIKVVGVMRVNADATSEVVSTGLGYTQLLTEYVLNDAMASEIVLAQKADDTKNVLTGTAFNSQVTYDYVMQTLGGDATPTGVQIYPTSFDSKDEIKAYIDAFNIGLDDENQIIYTDLAEVISSTISSLINTITIILTAFAAISLVVSSIMIGIITYVSVIERTKEIGIMRSLGARKKDISRIFNAETLLIGLGSGTLGILIYLALQTPLNLIIARFIDVDGFANLPLHFALGLILLSSTLTLISGLIPSRIAANKDPVTALRTE